MEKKLNKLKYMAISIVLVLMLVAIVRTNNQSKKMLDSLTMKGRVEIQHLSDGTAIMYFYPDEGTVLEECQELNYFRDKGYIVYP